MSLKPQVMSQSKSLKNIAPHTPVVYLCMGFPMVSETFISDQVEALLERGAPVKVLSLLEGNNPQRTAQWHADPAHAGVLEVMYPTGINAKKALFSLPCTLLKVLTRPSAWGLTLYAMRRMPAIFAQASLAAAWLRKHPQQGALLVCHFGTVGYIGALLKAWGYLQADIPQITVFHGFDMSSVLRRKGAGFYKKLFQSPRHASVPITEFWQKHLNGMGDPAATTLKLGVNTNTISFKPRAYPVNRPVRLITVGRLTDKKGQADVMKALATLSADHAEATPWEYHLIGAGPQQAELETLSQTLGLGGKVVFHGALPHTKTLEHLAKADVFVLTSRVGADGDMEGLPVALMEALASGMPTLSTYHSGIPELITHGETGLLSPEGDIEALAENLGLILGKPEMWETLTRAGRRKVEQDYDSVKNFQKFWTFLQKHSSTNGINT